MRHRPRAIRGSTPAGVLSPRSHAPQIAAAGRPGLVMAEMLRPGATVIDVGTDRTDDGLVGDVEMRRGARPSLALLAWP